MFVCELVKVGLTDPAVCTLLAMLSYIVYSIYMMIAERVGAGTSTTGILQIRTLLQDLTWQDPMRY